MAKTIHSKGGVDFVAGGRRWKFTHRDSGYEFTRDIPGGRETAEKVANLISASFDRAKKRGDKNPTNIDGLCRSNIHDLLHRAAGGQTFFKRMQSHPDHRFNYVPHI